jgi:hypothetical protein
MNFLKKINRLINPKGFEKINHKELNKLLKNNKIEGMDFLLSNHTKK